MARYYRSSTSSKTWNVAGMKIKKDWIIGGVCTILALWANQKWGILAKIKTALANASK